MKERGGMKGWHEGYWRLYELGIISLSLLANLLRRVHRIGLSFRLWRSESPFWSPWTFWYVLLRVVGPSHDRLRFCHMFPELLSVDDMITLDILHLVLVGTWGSGLTNQKWNSFIFEVNFWSLFLISSRISSRSWYSMSRFDDMVNWKWQRLGSLIKITIRSLLDSKATFERDCRNN